MADKTECRDRQHGSRCFVNEMLSKQRSDLDRLLSFFFFIYFFFLSFNSNI